MDIQILDVDCVQVGKGPHAPGWLAELRSNSAVYSSTPDANEIGRREKKRGYAYVVRLWGRTSVGESVCVTVADPWSTSYRKLKSGGGLENVARVMQEELNSKAQCTGMVDVSVVHKKTTNGYVADPVTTQPVRYPWLRIRVVNAFLKGQQSIALRSAEERCFTEVVFSPVTDAESRVEVHLELLQSVGLRPGGWLHLTAPVWARAETGGSRAHAHWQLQVVRDELVAASAETDQKISAIRVLSWDIECYSAQHAFPTASNADDVIIAIGLCTRTLYAEGPEAEREERLVLCLKDVERPSECDILIQSFETEASLLAAFALRIQESDADYLVGYNTCGFDWKYLKNRLDLLHEWTQAISEAEAVAMTRFSRVVRRACPPEEQQLGSAAMGDNPLCYPRTPGRVGLDLWFYLKRENAPDLPNLKLNTVASHYLGDTKVDLPAKAMFAEYESGPEGRFKVAHYCCQDCLLVLNLVQKLNVLPTLLEMAKVTRTIPEDLLYRGQQIKVYAQLLAAAHEADDYVVEDPAQVGAAFSFGNDDEDEDKQEKYKGAHVEEPKQGYYLDPVLTVDFASLYPSLMRTYNLSPDTLLPRDVRTEVPHAVLEISPDRAPLRFVAASHCRGLLPRILDTLLQERKRVKRAMANETNPFRHQLLNAKQLALKISANSVYGACGATKGLLQCREVAEATTATGRDIIGFTKDTIENRFRVPGCQVVYGDSVSADTPLLVRRKGHTSLCCIGDLETVEARWRVNDFGKQETFPEHLEVFSDSGFTPVKRVIRHECKHPLVRVSTATGSVDCTRDHSLLLPDCSPVTPACLRIGTRLLHADDAELLTAIASCTAEQVPCVAKAIGPEALGCFISSGSCGFFQRACGRKSAAWRVAVPPDPAVSERIRAALPFLSTRRRGEQGTVTWICPQAHELEQAVQTFRDLCYDRRGQKRVPAHVFTLSSEDLALFWQGCTQGRPRVALRGKLVTSGMWIVGRLLGYSLRMRPLRGRDGWFDLRVRTHSSAPLFFGRAVLSAQVLCSARCAAVYDLETASHHFHVAPGDMVVHNTDSAFVRLPETHRGVPEDVLFQLGEEMASQVTEAFREQLDQSLQTHCAVQLEMEKYLKPLILYKKKRYVGIAYEEVGKKGKVLAKGIELVRRDAVPLVRSSQAEVIEALLQRQSPRQAVACVKEAVRTVQAIPAGGPFTQIVLSKSLRQNYASPESMPHVKVASLMNERDAGSAPRVGDRVEYVVIASESTRVVDRVEDVGYARQENLPPDWYFYVEALERPLLRILEVPLADTAPDLHRDLQDFFKLEKATALRQRQQHSHARCGAHWVQGLASKKGNGLPQRRLEFFGFAAPRAPQAAGKATPIEDHFTGVALDRETVGPPAGPPAGPPTAAASSSQAPAPDKPSTRAIPATLLTCASAAQSNGAAHEEIAETARIANATLGGGKATSTAPARATARARPKAQLQGAHGKRACTALLRDDEERPAKMRQGTLG